MCEDLYIDDITGKTNQAQLIVRRGQEFTVKLFLDREFDKSDQIQVVALFGENQLHNAHLYKAIYSS